MTTNAPPDPRPSLLDLDRPQLEALLMSWGEPRYRAAQILHWVYRRATLVFEEMSDLPRPLRETLTARLRIAPATVVADQISRDGSTSKVLLRLDDGEQVETVLMRYDPFGGRQARRTVCVSTQAGCAMGCLFCATGAQGYRRQLTVGEVLLQVLTLAQRSLAEGAPLTNVVFMGMGEPFANYDVTSAALTRLTSADGMGLSPRRITVSTVGLIPGIRRLAVDHPQVNLAISLHAPDDDLRRRLVPVPAATVGEIIAAARAYVATTGRRVSFEYVLLSGTNDSPEQARALAQRLHGLTCHVNLIPINPSPGVFGVRPPKRLTLAFQAILQEAEIPATVRVEKGREIAAACGQLRGDRAAADTKKAAVTTTS